MLLSASFAQKYRAKGKGHYHSIPAPHHSQRLVKK